MGHSFNSMRHAAFRIKFVTFSKQRFQARHRVCAAIVAAFVVVVLVECVLCNVPFFRSLAASGDSAAAYNTLGPGLERRDDGLLEVTDPTQAYLQVAADGSSEYVRIVPVSDEVMGGVPAGSRTVRPAAALTYNERDESNDTEHNEPATRSASARTRTVRNTREPAGTPPITSSDTGTIRTYSDEPSAATCKYACVGSCGWFVVFGVVGFVSFVVCEGCGRSYGARAGGGAEGVIDSV